MCISEPLTVFLSVPLALTMYYSVATREDIDILSNRHSKKDGPACAKSCY